MWNGNIGTLTPKPRNMPPKIHSCALRLIPDVAPLESARMSKVLTVGDAISAIVPLAKKKTARKLTNMSAEPNSVYKKNFSDA